MINVQDTPGEKWDRLTLEKVKELCAEVSQFGRELRASHPQLEVKKLSHLIAKAETTALFLDGPKAVEEFMETMKPNTKGT